MYKRRDWLHLHGEDGGASDSSDDGDSDGDEMAGSGASSDSAAASQDLAAARHAAGGAAEASSGPSSDDSSDPEEASPGGYESEVSEPVDRRRLQDLSEEDFDSGQDDEDLEDLKESWLEVAEAGADHKPAGRALKCRACNGKLLLNALALQQHVASKQHLRKVKGSGGTPTDPICFADQLANNENVETHHERMQRLQQARQHSDELIAQQPQALSKGSGAAKRRRRQQRAKTGDTPGGKGQKKQGKPGKRQRSALKQGKQTAAGAPGGSSAKKHRAAKRHKPSGPVAV